MLSYFKVNVSYCSLSSGELAPSPQCALILEDEIGVCGYALALTDAQPAAAKTQVIKCNISSLSRIR